MVVSSLIVILLFFRYILNFIRDQTLDLESLTSQEKKSILLDAKFYQLIPLIDILEKKPIKGELIFTPGQNYTLSNNNKTATKSGRYSTWDCVILGNKKHSKGTHQWTVKIISNTYIAIMIGVAPFDIDRNGDSMYSQCGWYFNTYHATLYSGPPMSYSSKAFSATGKLAPDSIVTTKLDLDKKNYFLYHQWN